MATFKTRARTVDMLGRQQIANVATAINELFKNAHDAYADHAEVDYFKSDNLLAIRDDGVGMTPEEFEDRWLVLGTESKYAIGGKKANAYRPPEKVERAIMGEKGIGRLAIALLGRQVLVMTRAVRDGKPHELLMCFIHWGLFEASGVNLDEVEIPVRLVSGGRLPTEHEVDDLLTATRENVVKLAKKHGQDLFQSILNDIDEIRFDPQNLDEFLGGLNLKDNSSGTHFFVAPADKGIAQEIERERTQNSKEFSKFLLGFSNCVFREKPPPPLETAFRYWPTDSSKNDLIGQGEFFTHEELESADHLISGEFDEFGQFRGRVRVYDKVFDDHVIPWRDGTGRATECGPFEIEFGYVSGNQRESRLPPDEWKRILEKLNRIGGLYVYRDRIRILPYGNSDVDWLDIEQRRTKGAAYYFFSYRRVFGAVKLTRERNGRLKEKAGREGFRQDHVYRQLKDILENLFIQLVADFFRDSGVFSEYYSIQRAELERLELARREREKRVSEKRKKIITQLDNFFERIDSEQPESDLAKLRDAIESRMDVVVKMKDPDDASAALIDAEKNANSKLMGIRESYRLVKPRGMGFSRKLQSDWNAYLTEFGHLEKDLFEPFSHEIAQTLGVMAKEAKLNVDQRKRLGELIRQQAENEKKLVSREAGQLKHSVEDARKAALSLARKAIQEFQETVSDVELEFAHKDLSELSDEDIEQLRSVFENRVESVGRRNTETLSKVRDMLTSISANLERGLEIAELDIVEAMDQELQDLREQTDTDAELVQLGLAVAIINHEFEVAIRGVRQSLRELRPWAKSNKGLASLYVNIRNNFDHLDGHLNLFTPLQRRLYRKKIPIRGSDIYHYLKTLFETRLKRHRIKMEVTNAFLNSMVVGFPSTLYPVFVNILDNAIFWLKDVKDAKLVTLDANGAYLISNNGPGIPKRDNEAIFQQGFTRKPGGRGLGLFISRRALQKEGMDIEVVALDDNERGVTMKIKWPENDDT